MSSPAVESWTKARLENREECADNRKCEQIVTDNNQTDRAISDSFAQTNSRDHIAGP